MKGLTRAEYEELVEAARSCGGNVAPDGVLEVLSMLVEQGRVRIEKGCPHSGCSAGWYITPAGREALKLWPLLVERGLVSEAA